MGASFVGRPPGAEEHAKQFTTAVHVTPDRQTRVNDALFNLGHFEEAAIENKEPLSRTLERDVKAPASNELPILYACLDRLGIRIKSGYGMTSTPLEVVSNYDSDKTPMKLLNAYFSEKTYGRMFGGIERRKLEAAATADSVPGGTAARPALQTPLKDRERKAEYSFGIEDVYADVETTDLDQIDELVFENNDSAVDMFLRKELGDIKTTDVKISEASNKMAEIAIGLRWTEKFARNNVRMQTVDRWGDQVAIAARNALRDSGLYKIANDGSPTPKTVTGGKTRANLFGIGFELGEAYPSNILVMDVTTIKAWLTPAATTNIVQTIVDENTMPLNLLTQPAPNTDLGVTKDNAWHSATNDKVLNYVRDLTLNLYVRDDTFGMEVSYNPDNKSYKATITFEFVQVFIDRNGRILFTIS